MPRANAPIALPKRMIGKFILFSLILLLSSRKTPILPVYKFKPKTQTRIKPTENTIEANILPASLGAFDNKKLDSKNKYDPKPIAAPANMPK